MFKRIIATLFTLLLLGASPAFSQNVIVSNTIAPIAPFDSLVDVDCWYSNVGPIYNQVIDVKDGFKITWCVPNVPVATALTYRYSIKADTSADFILQASCIQVRESSVCLALLPFDVITVLKTNGFHLATVSAIDPASNLQSSMALSVRKPVCVDSSITYDKGASLPASILGALRNQQGSFTFESQIGKLRSEGFHIEWQRVQFGLDTDGKNGYWYMLGWCEGL